MMNDAACGGGGGGGGAGGGGVGGDSGGVEAAEVRLPPLKYTRGTLLTNQDQVFNNAGV